MLIVGAGVIGTVYGAHLAAAGDKVSAPSHGLRSDEVAAGRPFGPMMSSTGGGSMLPAAVVPDASGSYDIVLVAVRRDQWLWLARWGRALWAGKPALVFFGNNPAGRLARPVTSPGTSTLGSPGWRRYDRWDRPRRPHPAAAHGPAARRWIRGWPNWSRRWWVCVFLVQRVVDMDGWLAYHAASVARIAAALYRCGTDPVRLAAYLRDPHAHVPGHHPGIRRSLRAAMAQQGLPQAPAILQSPLLKPVAVRYWARTMRSPMGELCFAGHSRHAEAEMRALGA